MKKLSYISMLAMAAMAAFSCNKETEDPSAIPADLHSVVVKAYADNDDDTKTSLSGKSIVWSEDDVVSAFALADNAYTKYDSRSVALSNDGKTAEFEFEVSGDIEYVAYPASENMTMTTAGTFNGVVIPTSQPAVENGFAPRSNAALAKYENGVAKFKNVGGLLGIKFTSESDVIAIKLSVADGQNIAGTANVAFSVDGETVTATPTFTAGSSSVTLTATTDAPMTSGKTYYFCVAPGTYSGLTIQFVRADGYTATFTNSASLPVARNAKFNIGNLPLDSKWGIPYVGTFVKIDTMEELTDGEYVITGLNSDVSYYALPQNLSPKNSNIQPSADKVSVFESGGKLKIQSNSAFGHVWTITNLGDDGFTMFDGAGYVYHADGGVSETTLRYGDSSLYNWSISLSDTSDGAFKFACLNDGVKSRGMLMRMGDTPVFGGYSFNGGNIGTSYKYVDLFKREVSADPSKQDQFIQFPEEEYSIPKNVPSTSFPHPVVTGAMTTVTYSSSNTEVASVNSSTGEISLPSTPVTGTVVITATAAGNATYNAASASYRLTLLGDAIVGISGLKAATSGTNVTEKSVYLSNAIVTGVNGKYAFIEDAGAGVYVECEDHGLQKGQSYTGCVAMSSFVKNSSFVTVSALDFSNAVITTVAEENIPLTTVTIQNLKNAIANYDGKRVKIVGANNTSELSGTGQKAISQTIGSTITSISLYSRASDLEVAANSTIDVIGYAQSYRSDQPQILLLQGMDVCLNTSIKVFNVTCTDNDKNFPAAGGSATISIQGTVAWTAASTGTSTAVVSPSSGTGTGPVQNVTVEIPANTASDPKSYAVTVSTTETEVLQNSFTFNFSQKGYVEQEIWTLVTDASTLAAGNEIIIVAKDADVAMGAQADNNRGQVSVTKESDTVSFPADAEVAVITLGGTSGNWTLHTDEGYLYAAGGKTKNYLKSQSTSSGWTIAISSGSATITSNAQDTRNVLMYNSSSTCFSCYSSGQGEVCIYKNGTEVTIPIINVSAETITKTYEGGSFNDLTFVLQNIEGAATITCDGTVVTSASETSGTITYTLAANNGNADASGWIKISAGDIVKTVNITVTKAPDHTITLTPESEVILGSASGSTNTVKVKTNYAWTASASENPGFTFTPTSGTAGETTVTITASAVGGASVATLGTITFTEGPAEKSITVKQEAKASSEPTGHTGYVRVDDIDWLRPGDHLVIAASGYNFAMSTTQNSNNRSAVEVTKSSYTANSKTFQTLTTINAIQDFILEEGSADGTWAFYARQTGAEGYIYASSSSANQLKTESTLSGNSSWTISINTGNASIEAQGSNSRKILRYNTNNGSPIFSCYESATQQAVSLYKWYGEYPAATPVGTPVPTFANNTVSWTAIDGATGYKLIVDDGDEVTLSDTQYSLASLAAGTYSVTVKAVGNGTTTTDSDWSSALSCTVTGGGGDIHGSFTINQDAIASFTNTYNYYDWSATDSVNNKTVTGKLYAYKNSGIQFNSSKTGKDCYNTEATPNSISSIKMKKASGTDRSWTLYASDKPLTSSNYSSDGTSIGAKTVGTTEVSWTVTGSYKYFYLVVSGGATVIDYITITY